MPEPTKEENNYKLVAETISKFGKIITPLKKDIGLLLSYAIVSGLVSLTLPLGVQAIITFLMGGYLSTSLVLLIFLVIGGTFFVGVLQIFQLTIAEALQQKLFTYSSYDYAARIPSLKITKNGKYLFDELSNRFFDTLTLQKLIPKLILDLSTSGLQMVFGLILISFYHPFFAFFSLLLVLLMFLFFRISGPKGLRSSISESSQKFNLAYVIQRSGREHWWLKSNKNFNKYLTKIDYILTNYLFARKAHFKILANQYRTLVVFKTVIISILLIIGGNLVLAQEINLGQFIAAEIVIILIMGSVEKLLLSMEDIYDMLTAVDKVSMIPSMEIDEPVVSETNESIDLESVVWENVTLAYGNRILFENTHFSLNTKDRVAFVIPESIDRNLFLRALQGHVQPSEGKVLINGHQISRVEMAWLRQEMVMVDRADPLYNMTLATYLNIEENDPDIRKEMELIERVGLLNELDKWGQSLFEEIQNSWIFNSSEFLWRLGLARSLLYHPRVLLVNTGELSSDLSTVWLSTCIEPYKECGLWLAVKNLEEVPSGYRTFVLDGKFLKEI